jgi:tripartite-type tricarboxylate transporter receptor subunit TctC
MTGAEPQGNDLTVRTMAPQGASQDLFLRALEPIFHERFKTRLIIDNASGQDGIRAARLAKDDPPDGRHLLVTSSSTLTFYPALGDAGFDAPDFEPLLGVGRYNFVVITAGTQPWSDLRQMFDDIRAQGRSVRYAGTGQPDLLLVEAMARRVGVSVEFLPLNGPALLDAVVKGEADLGLGTGTHQPLLEGGRVRVMARLHPRAEMGPDTAPMPKDFGIGAVLDNCILISAPDGLAPAEKARLVDQLSASVNTPEIDAVLTRRLLMSPGLLRGAELEAALERQRRDFVSLRVERQAG